jgi:hypothetical protein
MRWCLALLMAAVTVVATAQRPRAQSAPGVCDITTTERVVAIGDIHGAHDQFTAILRAAKLVDARDRWIGGRAILVQTGDILDRGDDSRKSLDLLRRLERDAPRDGGRVLPLLGNHEVMRVVDDWRYVSAGEFRGFRNADFVDFREQVQARSAAAAAERARAEGRRFDERQFREEFLKEIPLGYLEMRLAFGPKGEYGAWVRNRAAVARINGIVFLHGGISVDVADLGCAGINDAVRKELQALPMPPQQMAGLLAVRETGPLWYRGLADEPEEKFAASLPLILKKMNARAVVIGHTVAPGQITPRFGGRVVQIDTGMLGGKFYPGGQPGALEISGDSLAAIYLTRRESLGRIPTS